MLNLIEEKIQLQEEEYDFPYHHIPFFNVEECVIRYRLLNWGFKYLCYTKHIAEKINFYRPKSILDIGCGDGRFLGMISEAIPKKVGIDISKKAINFARAFHPNIDFRCISIEDMDGSFDVITSIEVLEHIPDEIIGDFLNQSFSLLSNKGYMFICVPTTNIPLPKKHYRHYDLSLLCKHIDRAGVPYVIESIEYIYYQPKWLKIYLKKLTINRFWYFEPAKINQWIWHRIWNKYRYASEKDGHQLVVCVRKIDAK